MKPTILTQSPVSSILLILRLEIFVAALLFGMALPSVANDSPTPFPDPTPSSTSTLPRKDRYSQAPTPTSKPLLLPYQEVDLSKSPSQKGSPSQISPTSSASRHPRKTAKAFEKASTTDTEDQARKHQEKQEHHHHDKGGRHANYRGDDQDQGNDPRYSPVSKLKVKSQESAAPRYSPVSRLKVKPQVKR
jgi:hypothetical protein